MLYVRRQICVRYRATIGGDVMPVSSSHIICNSLTSFKSLERSVVSFSIKCSISEIEVSTNVSESKGYNTLYERIIAIY
jgi:hypothetical protein